MKDRLKEYIEKDEIYQNYKKGKLTNISDFDKFCIQHCKDIEELIEENKELKKQIDYLRSGEYINQLKFEVNMLQNVVDNMEVSKVDKEFIDMTHRNTELLEENQELKKQLEENKLNHKQLKDLEKIQRSFMEVKNQQQEFINYLEKEIVDCRAGSGQQYYALEHLKMFKEIIGETNDTK